MAKRTRATGFVSRRNRGAHTGTGEIVDSVMQYAAFGVAVGLGVMVFLDPRRERNDLMLFGAFVALIASLLLRRRHPPRDE